MTHAVLVAVALAVALTATACAEGAASRPPAVSVGDPVAGADAIGAYGCGSCHQIPGIDDADSLVGPPLTAWSRRSFIAGALTNSPENLQRWVSDPQDVEPGTAMPDVGVTEAEARDIAAYLFTLD